MCDESTINIIIDTLLLNPAIWLRKWIQINFLYTWILCWNILLSGGFLGVVKLHVKACLQSVITRVCTKQINVNAFINF